MDIIEIKEETKIPQENGSTIVLEAGDKIKVMKESNRIFLPQMGDTSTDEAYIAMAIAYGLSEASKENGSVIKNIDVEDGFVSAIVEVDEELRKLNIDVDTLLR